MCSHVNWSLNHSVNKNMNYQELLLKKIAEKLGKEESMGYVLSDILSISTDAAYRRFRCETPFTINELAKLGQHFHISLDELLNPSSDFVNFKYKPLEFFKSSLENYFLELHDYVDTISKQSEQELIMTVNNTPFIQLLNFPHLARFKLYFWAKNHLQVSEFKYSKFKHSHFPPGIFNIGRKILTKYNDLPSTEIYDSELLRGFAREIQVNYSSGSFENPHYALFLFDQLKQFTSHLKKQAEIGKKFIVNAPHNLGQNFQLFHNTTLNAITSIYYKTTTKEGLIIAHNYMNTLHTDNKTYIDDSKRTLDYVLSHSASLTLTNESGRDAYFNEIDSQIAFYEDKVRRHMNTRNQ